MRGAIQAILDSKAGLTGTPDLWAALKQQAGTEWVEGEAREIYEKIRPAEVEEGELSEEGEEPGPKRRPSV